MPPRTSIRRTGNEQLDLKLVDTEITATYIVILAYIVLLFSAYEDKKLISNRLKGIEEDNTDTTVSPARLVALSNSLVLIAYIIFGNVANTRYEEIVDSEFIKDTPLTPTPNLNISIGYSIAIIGCIFKVIGGFQRVNEEGEITIE